MRLVPDKITQVFGFRVNKRLRGKLQTVLERIDHGHHVLRACAKNAVIRMYEKFSTFLRLETLSNHGIRSRETRGLSTGSGVRRPSRRSDRLLPSGDEAIWPINSSERR